MRTFRVAARAILLLAPLAAHAEQKPAATMHDLQDHFAACFQPPAGAGGTRITFYFSLKSDGQVFGRLRTIWFGFKGSVADRKTSIARFDDMFAACLPLSLSTDLARTIPGKVYYLQYEVGGSGKATEVLLRPYGSDIPEPDEFYR